MAGDVLIPEIAAFLKDLTLVEAEKNYKIVEDLFAGTEDH